MTSRAAARRATAAAIVAVVLAACIDWKPPDDLPGCSFREICACVTTLGCGWCPGTSRCERLHIGGGCDGKTSDVPDSCVASDGCAVGQLRCVPGGSNIQVCIANHYQTISASCGSQTCGAGPTSDTFVCSATPTVARSVGDSPCATEGEYACSLDGGFAHRCRSGKWVATQTCRQETCALDASITPSPAYRCTGFGYAEGGVVCLSEDRATTCTPDKMFQLACMGGVYVTADSCTGGKTCVLTDATTEAKCQ